MKKGVSILRLFLPSLLFITAGIESAAQKRDRLEMKANDFFENREYNYSAILYDSLRKENPENLYYLKRSALSHKYFGNIRTSISLFQKALRGDTGNAYYHYQLGDLYDIGGKPDSALYHFKQAHQLNPTNNEILNRISILYLDSPSLDSAYLYSGKALENSETDPASLYARAMIYINDSRYADAIDMSRKGLSVDSSYTLFYLPLGLAHFYRHNYDKAVESFTKGYRLHSDKSLFAGYLVSAVLFENTPEDVYRRESESTIIFRDEFHNPRSGNSKEVYQRNDYTELLSDLKDVPYSLGIHDFYRLYLGFSGDKNFTGRLKDEDLLKEYWQNGSDDEYLRLAREVIAKYPVHFPLYSTLSQLYFEEGNHERALEYLFSYYGFSRAILAGGDGRGPAGAYRVCWFEHINELLHQLGFQAMDERMIEKEGEFYTVVTVQEGGELRDIYFDISIPVRRLGIEKQLSKQIRQ